MQTVKIADVTLKEGTIAQGATLSFRDKIEIAKLLDKVKIDVIEMPRVENEAADTLLLKTISSLLLNSTVSVDAGSSDESARRAGEAIKEAKFRRLRVELPTSTVQMEYLFKCKPKAMISLIEKQIKICKEYAEDVEFVALDATRSEIEFLSEAVKTAIHAGATTVTVCDTVAQMLPEECKEFIKKLYDNIPELSKVSLGISTQSELYMSSACALTAVMNGAVEVKTSVGKTRLPRLEPFVHLIQTRGESFSAATNVNTTELSRTVGQIKTIAKNKRKDATPFDNKLSAEPQTDLKLTEESDISEVGQVLKRMGYTLSDDDIAKVYEAFLFTAKKKKVSSKDLEAIVATEALQVPPTYKLVSFVVNSGNVINPTANIILEKQGKRYTGLSSGDGPIDAALLALEQIIGCHYELDDFQIQAVTEGREAMGEALIKLRADGKLYSGRGISTDIIGATIRAYVNALNKIVYGEA